MWLEVEFNDESYPAVTYKMTAETKVQNNGQKYPEEYRKLSSAGAKIHHVDTLYYTGYGFPVYIPEGNTTIQAEIITLPIESWPNIDRLEGYPRLYSREIVPATLPDGTTAEGRIYIMICLPPQAKIIKPGDWKHRN